VIRSDLRKRFDVVDLLTQSSVCVELVFDSTDQSHKSLQMKS